MAPISFKISFLASLLLFSLCLGTRSIDGVRGVEAAAKCSSDVDCGKSCPIGWYFYCEKDSTCRCLRDRANAAGADQGKKANNDVVIEAAKCTSDPDCESQCPSGPHFFHHCDNGACKCRYPPRCFRNEDCFISCPPVGSVLFCDNGTCKCL